MLKMKKKQKWTLDNKIKIFQYVVEILKIIIRLLELLKSVLP